MRAFQPVLKILIGVVCLGVPSLLLASAPDTQEMASAKELYTARRDDEAKAAFEKILSSEPRSHESLYYLARLAKRSRNWDAVASNLEAAIKIEPDNAIYWGDLGEAYGGQARTAGTLSQLGLARKTRDALKKALSLEPDNILIRIGLVTFYREAPWIAGGGMDKAHAEAEIVRKQDPFRGAMVIGGLYQQQEKWAEAEKEYREAIRINPAGSGAQYALAQLFTLTGRHDEAFAMFEDILQQNPDHFASLYQIGRVAALSGKRLARGEAALRQYLDSPIRAAGLPSHAHAWNRLGNVLEKRGDATGAREAYMKALELDPKLKDASDALAKLK